jgi:branched-chain amino acid transport system substrate-binding protein
LLTTSATNPKITVDDNGNVREYIFRVCFIDPPQGIVGADFAYNTLQARTAALFKDTNNDYSKGLAENFKQSFEALGGKIVGEEGYLEGDKDFKAALTKIKGKNPDLIYVPGYYSEVGPLVKQARDLGITAPFLGADGWDSPELLTMAGPEALQNTYFTNHYSSQDPDPAIQKFVEAYKAKYNAVPDSFAALGYDAAYLLVDAIKRAGAAEPEKIKDALAQTTDFPGVTGKLTFDSSHNPIKQIAIIEMVDGNQVLKTKLQPQ